MSDTVSGLNNETGRSSRGEESHHGLDGKEESLNIVLFEHNLSRFRLLIIRHFCSLSEEDSVLSWVNFKLVGEAVIPDLIHVIPVLDNSS